jgi:hypothetical protein
MRYFDTSMISSSPDFSFSSSPISNQPEVPAKTWQSLQNSVIVLVLYRSSKALSSRLTLNKSRPLYFEIIGISTSSNCRKNAFLSGDDADELGYGNSFGNVWNELQS